MTADEIRVLLKFEPHATCGFVRVTFMSEKWIRPWWIKATICRRPSSWVRSLLYGNAGGTRAFAQDPQRSAL